MIWISQWKKFDRFILFLILLNSLFLALQDYSFRLDESNKTWRNTLVEEAEIYFLCFFTIEAVIKIIAKGFVIGKWAYLKDAWNVIDFLVVLIGWLGFIPGMVNVTALRTIRVLRPLKSIKKIPSLRKMVRSLFRSLPALANVVIFLGFIFIIFGIIGVAFLQGGYYQRCRYTEEPDGSSWPADPDITQLCTLDGDGLYSCPEDRYCGLPGLEGLFDYDFYREAEIPELDFGIPNFDNIATACLTIFQVTTLEGWSPMMYNYYGSHNPLILSLYFSIMVILISFFILNLMLAAIWSSFKIINAEEQVVDDNSVIPDEDYKSDDEMDSIPQETSNSKLGSELSRKISASLRNGTEKPQVDDKKQEKSSPETLKQTLRDNEELNVEMKVGSPRNSGRSENEEPEGESLSYDPFKKHIESSVIHEQSQVRVESEVSNKSISSEQQPEANAQVRSASTPSGLLKLLAPLTEQSEEDLLDSKKLEKSSSVYSSQLRSKTLFIVESWWFGAIINTCIIVNTIILALNRYPMPEKETQAYEIANLVFFGIFFIEMVLKLASLHLRRYCQSRFNIFDGIIVILSSIEIILYYSGVLGDGGSIIIAFRAFRLLRVFKLAKKWTELRKLMRTIFKCLQDVSYFSVLLLLFMFIYTLIGMELYAYKLRFSGDEVDLQDGMSPRENFDDFLHAFVSVFIALVGDDWQIIMYDAIRCQGYFSAVLYFVTLLLIGNVILLNLFLSILFHNFEKTELEEKEKTRLNMERKTRLERVGRLFEKQCEKVKVTIDVDVDALKNYALEGKSLYIFSTENRLRRFLFRIVKSKHFENTITVIIVISSITLAIDNPLNDPESDLSITLYSIDMIVSCIFIVEAGIKIIVRGFAFAGPRSYIRIGWNVLDFILVILSILSFATDTEALGKLKAFRAFRVLKPLRFIAKSQNLRLSINSFLKSIPNMINVLIISLFFALVFGIVCVNYLKGALYYCDLEEVVDTMPSQIKTQQDWLNFGGVWVNQDSNFDNAGVAILTLFIAATKEGWANIMYSATDAVGIGKEPQFENEIGWMFFFIFIVVFGSFFMLNLLPGIVIDKFNIQTNVEKGIAFLSPEQQEFAMMKTYMLNYKPLELKDPPEKWIRRYWFYIAENKAFEIFILICIILNSIVMTLHWYGQPEISIHVFDIMNRVFIVIFILEAAIKITAYLGKYWKSGHNIFDFLIVVVSVLELILERYSNTPGLNVISFFRIFRIGRVLRLVKSAKQLRVIVGTFVLSIPQVCNIGALLLLFMYIFTVLGVQLFAKVRVADAMNEYANFQEFWKAFMLLVRCASGEAWNELMFAAAKQPGPNYDCIDDPTYEQIQDNDGEPNGCGSGWSYFYFISFLLLVAFVELNLFIAVILQQFDVAHAIENGRLTGRQFKKFQLHWSRYDPTGSGFIDIQDFDDFLATLDPPLGHHNCNRTLSEKILKHVKQREINVYEENTYHFYEVSNALASYSYKLEGTKLQPETQDLCFTQIEQTAMKRFPVLNRLKEYTSRHIFYLLKIQRAFRPVIAKLKRRRTMGSSPSLQAAPSQSEDEFDEHVVVSSPVPPDLVKESDDEIDEKQIVLYPATPKAGSEWEDEFDEHVIVLSPTTTQPFRRSHDEKNQKVILKSSVPPEVLGNKD